MAHQTRVNGTVYEITGGRTRVNGTGYEIASGKTRITGTAYDLTFAKPYSQTWYFNDTVDSLPTLSYSITCKFVCDGITYGGFGGNARGTVLTYMPISISKATTVYSTTAGWANEKYRTIEVTEEPADAVLQWLEINAKDITE